ncbi:YsnF/AvaK domain-containing protein [Arthrobacter sp. NPDC057009]|uniref:YsnF/AvaK domain-containing protein n=1 Tax=Arthrobacter sp. NPDC057009 TaxID=3345996 RepID=UPI003624EE28
MLTKEHIDDLLNKNGNIVSADGDKIGSFGQVYADDANGQPTWVTARTGLFGTSESFIPLEGARLEGDDIVVPYSKNQVKDAPRVDADGHLDPAEEDRLYEHYQLNGNVTYSEAANGHSADSRRTTEQSAASRTATDRDAGFAAAGSGGTYSAADDRAGRGTAGLGDDDAMTRSEERLNVGTERQAAGRARLRKYVVTENVTQTVPVQREEVRLEREPITEGNRGEALNGPDISEAEHEVVLHEERPVVDKEAVPVERVKLDTETVTDEVTVDEQVRKERIETDGVEDTRR